MESHFRHDRLRASESAPGDSRACLKEAELPHSDSQINANGKR
jgi:hypothetical protein